MWINIKQFFAHIISSKEIFGTVKDGTEIRPIDIGYEMYLLNPSEELGVEYKSWLTLIGKRRNWAILAKAVISVTNYGGGVVILGWKEDRASGSLISDPVRPANNNWQQYSPENITRIINLYSDPEIQCRIRRVANPDDGLEYIFIETPYDFETPIRTKKNGPDEGRRKSSVLRKNLYYIRKPGPRTEIADGSDLGELMERCLRARKKRNV